MKELLSIIFGLCIALSLNGQQPAQTQKLSVKLTNIKTKSKILFVGLYRKSDEFPELTKTWKNAKIKSTSNESTIEFDVPYGEYAIAVFHDLNGNGKLDKNLFGYPSEAFGFSNNIRPKFSSPDFSDCKHAFNQNSNTLTIELN